MYSLDPEHKFIPPGAGSGVIAEEQLRLALGRTYRAIGEILSERNIVSPIQLDMALEEQRQNGKRLGTILVSHGWATEEDISQAVAEQLGFPWVDLKECPITLEALECVPEMTARRYSMMPIDRKPEELTVAIADPSDLLATDHLAATLGCRVKVVISTESSILHAIESRYKDESGASRVTRAVRIGQYRIDKELRRLGAVTVYLATDSYLDRPVLLKVLSPLPSLTQQEYDRLRHDFLRRARLMGSLVHYNFPVAYAFGEEERHSFSASEYVDGLTVESLLHSMGTLPISKAVPMIIQICDALDYAHRQGIVHGAVRPDNIMILQDSRVKLDGCEGSISNEAGMMVDLSALISAANYLAPEQVKDEPVDRRVDVFSLGVTFYEMLTNRKPFEGSTIVSISHKIVTDPVQVPEDIPLKLQAIIAKALEKEPGNRYQSAADMKQELTAYRWQPDAADRPEKDPADGLEQKERQALADSLSIPTRKPARRFRWAWIVLPLLLAGITLAAIYEIPRQASGEDPGPANAGSETAPVVNWPVPVQPVRPHRPSSPPEQAAPKVVLFSDFEKGASGWSLAGTPGVIRRVSLSNPTGGASQGNRWLRITGLRFGQRGPDQALLRFRLPPSRAINAGDTVKLDAFLPSGPASGVAARLGLQTASGFQSFSAKAEVLAPGRWTTIGGRPPRPVASGEKIALMVQSKPTRSRVAVGLDNLRVVRR
ncbi:MAG: protein kinase [Armatimonadetes bacterium]|nr:protein kinase [Armatimonadota bacterium]